MAAAVIVLRAVSPADREYFHWYWEGGFWPVPPRSASDLWWPFKQLTYAFGAFGSGPRRTNGGLNYPWSPLFTVIMLTGYVALWKEPRDAALFLVVPALLTLIASALRLYPFTGRVLAFLEPGFLLATAAGARHVLRVWPERLQLATPALLAVLGGAPIYAAARALPPERIEHVRPLIATIAGRLQPDDAVYVYHGAGQATLVLCGEVRSPPRRPDDRTMRHCEPEGLSAWGRSFSRPDTRLGPGDTPDSRDRRAARAQRLPRRHRGAAGDADCSRDEQSSCAGGVPVPL